MLVPLVSQTENQVGARRKHFKPGEDNFGGRVDVTHLSDLHIVLVDVPPVNADPYSHKDQKEGT